MKTLSLMVLALALSAGAAFADCSYHNTSAAVDVDRQMTTASIAPAEETAPITEQDVVLLKKTQRHAPPADTTE
jgi:hypothetical protein